MTYCEENYNNLKQVTQDLRSIYREQAKVFSLRKKKVSELNDLLKDKVKLKLECCYNIEDMNFFQHDFPYKVRRYEGEGYQYEIEIRKQIKKLYELSLNSPDENKFDFFVEIFEGEQKTLQKLVEEFKVDIEKIKIIRKYIDSTALLIFPEHILTLEYNINDGKFSEVDFRNNSQISLGQNAVAILLLILQASSSLYDDRPLLMDQPEDDLDNSYIYTTLTKSFKELKGKRQLILSTHNANLPVGGDAENIVVLDYNGKNCYLKYNGSLEQKTICRQVLSIMEGGQEALQERNKNYEMIVF